jgi:hypothetical protein
MREEHPDAGEGTTRSGDASPKPGHFLPGGAGDVLTDADRAAARPLTLNRQQSLGLGKARAVTPPVDPALRRKARPLAADPNAADGFGAPPAAPLPGAPVAPLAGTRRTGGTRPVGWHSPSSRTGARFSSELPSVKPPRQYSRAVIAGLSVLALIMVTGGTFAGFKLIDSYGNTVDNPLARPSVKTSTAPIPVPPDPTVTVTATPVPDLVRLRQNKIYVVGKIPTVGCKEPTVKPNSQANILRYYQALMPCLNRAWEPLVKKAGYPFRPPKLQVVSKNTSPCLGVTDRSFYCGADETISMQWQDDLKHYRENPLAVRVLMMSTLAHEYGHHVQMLTNILISSESREGWTKSNAVKLEWNRRKELQASCFSAAFLGANKQALGFRGEKLRLWEYFEKHSGDEYDEKKIRDHGSRKNQWLWSGAAFKSASPASCNTYSASSGKVS